MSPAVKKRRAKQNRPAGKKAAGQQPIRVSVLESDPLRFVGLRTLFGRGAEFRVRSSTLPMILKALDDDVVLMTKNRGAAFYSGMTTLKSVRPDVRIIVTGAGGSDEDILRAIMAGAKGYVTDDASPAEFRQAIRVVHSGSVWAPRRLLATFIERVTAPTMTGQAKIHDGDMISNRQRQVLSLLAAGRSNREIATELSLAERTVKAHVAELLRKIGAPNRIALSVHPVTLTLVAIDGTSQGT